VAKSPAERAGIKAGDVLLSAGGAPMRNFFDFMALRVNLAADYPYWIEIERGNSRVAIQITLKRVSSLPRPLPSWVSAVTLYLARIVALSMALLVAFRRPYDPQARFGAAFLAMLAVLYTVFPPGLAVAWRHLPFPIRVLMWIPILSTLHFGPLLFAFFAVFPRPLFHRRWLWYSFLVIQAGLAVAGIVQLYPMFAQPGPIGLFPGWFIVALSSNTVIFALAGFVALLVNYRRTLGVTEQRRLRIVVIGSAVGILPGMLMALAYWAGYLASYSIPVQQTISTSVNSCFALLPVAFAYSILRRKLFDVGTLIRIGLQYLLVRNLVLSIIPGLAAVLILDLLLHGEQPLLLIVKARGWVYFSLSAGAVVIYFQRQDWMTRIDRRFFRERYDAHRLVSNMIRELQQAESFESAAHRVVAQIEAVIHPIFTTVMVREETNPTYNPVAAMPAGEAPPSLPADSKIIRLVRLLEKPLEMSLTESGWLARQLPMQEIELLRGAGIELIVPIVPGGPRRDALLVFGAKRSEEPYTVEDEDWMMMIVRSLSLLLGGAELNPPTATVVFRECLECGQCYDSGFTRCHRDQSNLATIALPRVLAGRYRLERRLGQGGMGTVYESKDIALERQVAVKILREDVAATPDAAARFQREARLAAAFDHPNVVTVHDFGIEAGVRGFLVMELLKGQTLREELQRRGRFDSSATIRILRDVCSAVETAHRRQLLHRDLKPENIFLVHSESREAAKVLDFGLAKSLFRPEQSDLTTGSGILMGTLQYMCPEQLRGQHPEPAWDVWSLSVVAYEMLTAMLPFKGSTLGQWNEAVIAGRFTPVELYLNYAPASWNQLFADAFSADQHRRPKSVQSLFSRLEHELALVAGQTA